MLDLNEESIQEEWPGVYVTMQCQRCCGVKHGKQELKDSLGTERVAISKLTMQNSNLQKTKPMSRVVAADSVGAGVIKHSMYLPVWDYCLNRPRVNDRWVSMVSTEKQQWT